MHRCQELCMRVSGWLLQAQVDVPPAKVSQIPTVPIQAGTYNTIRVFIFKLYSFPKLAFSRGIGGASCASVGHSVGGREGLLRAVPARCATMVFHFQVRGGYTVYMGRDKYENEKLIKWGWPEDVWFHVDDMSSAHVYLRMKEVGRPCGLTAACISLLMHGWSPLMICHGACGT